MLFKDAGSDVFTDISLDMLSLVLAPEQMVLLGLGDGYCHFELLGECADEPVPRRKTCRDSIS